MDGFGSWAIYWIYLNVSLGSLLFLCFNSYAMAKMKNIQQRVFFFSIKMKYFNEKDIILINIFFFSCLPHPDSQDMEAT